MIDALIIEAIRIPTPARQAADRILRPAQVLA